MGDGIKAYIALESTGNPRSDASFPRQRNPLTASCHATVQRGFEDDVTGTNGVQQVAFALHRVHTNEFLINGDGQRG